MILNSNKDINNSSDSKSDNYSLLESINQIYVNISEVDKIVENTTQLISLDTKLRRGYDKLPFDKQEPPF